MTKTDSDLFIAERPNLVQYAHGLLRDRHAAEDAVQSAFVSLAEAANDGTPKGIAFIRQLVHCRAVDILRNKTKEKNSCLKLQSQRGDMQSQQRKECGEQKSIDGPIELLTRDLNKRERALYESRVGDRREYSEIAAKFRMTNLAARKALSRIREKTWPYEIAYLYLSERFSTLNQTKLCSADEVARLSRAFEKLPGIQEHIYKVFNHKALNRASKNASLLLRHFLPRPGEPSNRTEKCFVDLLENGDLYRGQKMYIADALIDADYNKHIRRFENEYLRRLEEMDDRKSVRVMPKKEVVSPSFQSLYDFKPVPSLGTEISASLANYLCERYAAVDSFDLRRSMSLQLQRLHPLGDAGVLAVIRGLDSEIDQANACYVVNFLCNVCCHTHPHVFDNGVAKAVAGVSDRWPENVYLRDSARRISELVKHACATKGLK